MTWIKKGFIWGKEKKKKCDVNVVNFKTNYVISGFNHIIGFPSKKDKNQVFIYELFKQKNRYLML